jgi:hypothetical protein
MNCAYFGAGLLALLLDKSLPLKDLNVEICQWVVAIVGLLLLMLFQIGVRHLLIADKTRKGY